MFKKIFLFVFLAIILVFPAPSLAKERAEIYFFYSDSCPHCHKEAFFLDKLEDKYGDSILIKRLEVSKSENVRLLINFGQKLNADVSGVPFTVVGEEYFIGYLSDETTGFKIENALKERLSQLEQTRPLPNEPEKPGQALAEIENQNTSTSAQSVEVPGFGTVDLKDFSLPIITIILGALDGFNPCAMWALLFLISLLLGMQDKKRMWILGTTFIVASAFIYFLFMAAWLNIILFIGFIIWVRLIIGAVAIGGGLVNIRKYFKNKDGGCEVTKGEERKKVFEKLKSVATQRKFILAFFGIIALAFAVNLVELICSAGLPAIYAQILALNDLSSLERYLYILLYIFFFMLDDLLVFFVAMITLQLSGISTKYSRWSSLVGGVLMLAIGLILILRPEWLMFG